LKEITSIFSELLAGCSRCCCRRGKILPLYFVTKVLPLAKTSMEYSNLTYGILLRQYQLKQKDLGRTNNSVGGSDKLLLVLAGILNLGFGHCGDALPYFCSFQTFTSFEMGG
jgi:hypothetical protein